MSASRRGAHEPWDRPLLAIALGLTFISLIALRSASATLNPMLLWKQAIWAAAAIGLGTLLACRPYTRWTDLGLLLYGATLLLLGMVLVAGTMKMGATRWLTIVGLSIQPSELAKLATACCLARYLGTQPTPLSARSLVLSAIVVGIPALLIFLQPDLGTSSVLGAVWVATVWAAGISRRHLTLLALIALIAMPLGWHALKEYQRARLLVFLNPQADPLGAGYTIIQSAIAIGSGQLLGRGWMAGTQNQLNFLPERHADFLYSVIGEEWGFLGSAIVVALYAGLIWRGLVIAMGNGEPQGRLLAVALVAWIGYQAVVNMGMVMGLVPVVGVPLPLLSYGGSAMLTTWLAVGLLQSVRRFGTRF